MNANLNFDDCLTTKQFGALINPPRTAEAVSLLCLKGKVQGAVRHIFFGRPIWLIPKTALETFNVEYRNRRTKKQIEEDKAKEALKKKGETK